MKSANTTADIRKEFNEIIAYKLELENNLSLSNEIKCGLLVGRVLKYNSDFSARGICLPINIGDPAHSLYGMEYHDNLIEHTPMGELNRKSYEFVTSISEKNRAELAKFFRDSLAPKKGSLNKEEIIFLQGNLDKYIKDTYGLD